MILLEVHDGLLLEPMRLLPAGSHNRWRILTPCDDDPIDNAGLEDVVEVTPLLREAAGYEGGSHFDVFYALIESIIVRAQIGRPLEEVFNAKQLHNVGQVTVKRPDGSQQLATVFQFEKQRTVVRLLWLYGPPRRTLIITHMFVKKTPKTPPVEVERAGAIFKSYVHAVESGSARLIKQQGGRNGFEQLGK